MNEAPDPLERELSALRPREVSPGLRRRIAERLADDPPLNCRRPWRLAFVGGLAAACIAAVLFWWSGGHGVIPDRNGAQPAVLGEVVNSGPTLLAYQRALARSPEELDALLDSDAVVPPELNPQLVRVCAFTRSGSELNALLGED